MLGQSSLLTSMMAAPSASGLRPQDVFATSLYTGNGASRTITTNLNMSGEGGMVWTKERSAIIGGNHFLCDTVRGANKQLSSNTSLAEQTRTDSFNSFTGTGYTLGSDGATGTVNWSGASYVSWSFRKDPKFFDVVTYTGTGANRTIAHNLGSVPGMVIVKGVSIGNNWGVWHNSFPGTDYIILDSYGVEASNTTVWNSTVPTASVFSLGPSGAVNTNGEPYIAYLFAHDTGAGGVVQCGTFNSDLGSTRTVTLGWRPQFVMFKRSTSGIGHWRVIDSARGFAGSEPILYPNLNSAETVETNHVTDTSTGFTVDTTNLSTGDYIYLAIREPV